jgi:hypothetical protein
MTRMIRKLVTATAIVVLAQMIAPTQLQAQFGPSVRYNYQFGLYPSASFNPFLPSLPNVPGRFSSSNYTLSGTGANGPYSVSFGYYRNSALSAGSSVSPYSGGYYSGVGGASASASSGRVASQQRAAVAAAQQTARINEGGKPGSSNSPDFEQWMKEQSNRRESKDPNQPPAIDPALISPPEEAIRSGDALNRILDMVAALESKGLKADSGLCGPDLLAAITFENGPAADAANQFRMAELVFPDAMAGMPFSDLRDALNKAYAPVAAQAHAGKRTNPADVERLIKEVAKAREVSRPLLKEMGVNDTWAASQFFIQLESATKFLKDPNSAGVAGVKWESIGATVSEVVKLMTRFKLRFGAAGAGEDAAYRSLHRGLLTYYVGLLQAK